MARYVYPLERDPEFKSRIVFQVVKVNPPTFADKNGADPTLTSMSGKKGSIQGTEVTSMSLEYTGDKMDLYLPMAFQVNDALNYSNPELGLSGAAAQAAWWEVAIRENGCSARTQRAQAATARFS